MIDLNKPFGWDAMSSKQGGGNTVGPLGGGNVEGTAPVLQLPETEQEKALKAAKGKATKMAVDETIKGVKSATAAPLADVGAGMASTAEQAAMNTALADATGAGMASVAEEAAINAATDSAASGAAGSVAGPLAGGAIAAAQGNYGQAAGSTIGGIAGAYFGPLGSMAGSALGGYLGGLTGYAEGTPNVQPLAQRNNYYGELRRPAGNSIQQAQAQGKSTGGNRVSTPMTPSRTSSQSVTNSVIPFNTVTQQQAAALMAAQQAGYVSPAAQAEALRYKLKMDEELAARLAVGAGA